MESWVVITISSGHNVTTLFQNLQRFFNIQGAWNSPNILPTIVHWPSVLQPDNPPIHHREGTRYPSPVDVLV